jgi:tetratricopeptide (TPR) repeat protein
VARLLILRGETLDREVELKHKTVRLGRGQQNEVMLEDEGKSVSRNHAEIRYEGGRYVLVDLESQNGVWVSGAKVPYVVLEPNVVASLGPYRLMLASGGGSAPSGPDSRSFDSSPTGSGQIEEDSGARRDPRAEPRAGGRLGPPPAPQTNWFSRQPMWLLGSVGAAVLGVTAIAVTGVMRGSSAPTDDTVALMTEEHLNRAGDLIQAGSCASALSEHIEPVLANDPANAEALALKEKATICASPDPSATSTSPSSGLASPAIAANLAEALKQIDAGKCEIALNDHLAVVLASDPTNAEALALKSRAETACRTPQPPTEAQPALARRILPEKGGLEPAPGELQRDYESRVRGMRARYDEAQAALTAASYQKALDLFTAVVRDAGDRYLDAGRLLIQARESLKDSALKIYAEARDHEAHEEWDKAIQEFRRAQTTDPSTIDVSEDIKRVTERKTALGLKNCDVANANYLLKRNEVALQNYEAVLRLLPADHRCFIEAKERVALLKK